MKIYTGTSGYGYREWKGKFYPEKISPGEMLRFYSQHLNAVEINNTFYRMPTRKVLASWAEQVPGDFVFALKAPQVITHVKRLRNAALETEYFFGTLSELGRRSGPVLFQFPASFHADSSVLRDFLDMIPGTISCAFEFRHPSWIGDDILNLLSKKKCSLCIADTDENPARKIISAASWGYLRLRRSDYTDAELAEWRENILAQKWKEAFVFFKHEEGPDAAIHFHELAGSEGKKKTKKVSDKGG